MSNTEYNKIIECDTGDIYLYKDVVFLPMVIRRKYQIIVCSISHSKQ